MTPLLNNHRFEPGNRATMRVSPFITALSFLVSSQAWSPATTNGIHNPMARVAIPLDTLWGTVDTLWIPSLDVHVSNIELGEDSAGHPTLYGMMNNTFFIVDPQTGVVRNTRPVQWGGPSGDEGDPMDDSDPLIDQLVDAPTARSLVDGKIYLAGRVSWQVYNPKTDALELISGVPKHPNRWAHGHPYSSGLTVTESGTAYLVVAYDTLFTRTCGRLLEYSPTTGMLKELGNLDPIVSPLKQSLRERQPIPPALLPLPNGRILVGCGTPSRLLLVDLQTGRHRDILPLQYAQYHFADHVERVGSTILVEIVMPTDRRVLRFDARTLAWLGEVPEWHTDQLTAVDAADGRTLFVGTVKHAYPERDKSRFGSVDLRTGRFQDLVSGAWVGQTVYQIEFGGQRWLTSVSPTGLWGRWNPETGELVTRQLVFPDPDRDDDQYAYSHSIITLERGPDGKLYGTGAGGATLFTWDPTTQRDDIFENLSKSFTTGHLGTVSRMTWAQGKLFFVWQPGEWREGTRLMVYNPAHQWRLGPDVQANPRSLDTLQVHIDDPRAMTVGSDSNIYLETSLSIGVSFQGQAGMLMRINPVTYAVTSWRNLAGGQPLNSMAAGDGVLYLGTSRQPPREWNTIHPVFVPIGQGRQSSGSPPTRPRFSPHPDSTSSKRSIDEIAPPHLLIFDPVHAKVIYRTVPDSEAYTITALAVAANGLVYGGTNRGTWFTFDPVGDRLTFKGFLSRSDHGNGIIRLQRGPDGRVWGVQEGGRLFRIDPHTNRIDVLNSSETDDPTTQGAGLVWDNAGRLYWPIGRPMSQSLMRWTPSNKSARP